MYFECVSERQFPKQTWEWGWQLEGCFLNEGMVEVITQNRTLTPELLQNFSVQ